MEGTYPQLNFNPDGQHCAFTFHLMFRLNKNNYTSLEDEENYKEENRRLIETFPPPETLAKSINEEHEENLKEFTESDWETYFVAKQQGELLINTNARVYAPSLIINLNVGYIQSELHNGGTAQLAANMWFYGLEALKGIYKAYEIDTEIPSIIPEKDKLILQAPFYKVPIRNTGMFDYIKENHGEIKQSKNKIITEAKVYENQVKVKQHKNPELGILETIITKDKENINRKLERAMTTLAFMADYGQITDFIKNPPEYL